MFTEFRRVPVFCVTKWRSVVSVSSFEGVFCESNVCFRSVIVVTFDCCLVDNWSLKAVSVKRACVLLSAVTWFVVNRVICGFFSVFGWIQDTFVVVVDNLFSVIHATVADLDGIVVEDFSEFVLFSRWFWIFLSLNPLKSERSRNRLVGMKVQFFSYFLYLYIMLYFNLSSTLLRKNRNTGFL